MHTNSKNKKLFEYEKIPNETTKLLTQNLKLSKESENIGENVFNEMDKQSSQLLECHSKLDDINNVSETTKNSVKIIQMKIYQKKANLYLLIGILLIIDVLLITRIITNKGYIL